MVTFSSLYSYNPMLFVRTSSSNLPFASSFLRPSKFTVRSSHSNPKIHKTNKKSIYGKFVSPYDSDEDDDEEFADPADLDAKGKRLKSKTLADRQHEKEEEKGVRSLNNEQSSRLPKRIASLRKINSAKDQNEKEHEKGVRSLNNGQSSTLPKIRRIALLQENVSAKFGENSTERRYPKLSKAIVLDVNWLPLLDYLSTFGIKESQFIQIYERHMSSFQVDLYSAQERIDYLLSLGVKHRNISQILLRHPQILEYTVENNLKTHVAFLMGLGVPSSKLGQIIASTPSIFSYSVENSLKPTVRYLIEEIGFEEKDLGKVIQLSPEILVQRIELSWNTRFMFLTKELGAPKESIMKMVTEYPPLLYYSIDDELLPRINFLRSLGVKNADILEIFTSLTKDVLSLSLEVLKPKFLYLVNELHNEVISLTKCPWFLHISMEKKVRPRHTFLVSLKKAPRGQPFPLQSLNSTDEVFCQRWAGTTLDEYLLFCGSSKERRYPGLSEAIVLDVNLLPLFDYLSTFGIKKSQFLQIYERHMSSFQVDLSSAQERIDYLLSIGVKRTDIKRILLRHPQILEYTVENNLKTHVAFLMDLGVPSSKLGQIIASTPSIFSYSIENSLKPMVRYLIEEVGIEEKDLGEVIQLSPEILVQRILIPWNTRFMFLTKELGAPKESIVKMVTQYPPLLHYSIDHELLPRINFLRSLGLKNADILDIFTSLTKEVLFPSLENTLKPKFLYLVNELHLDVTSISKFQLYRCLSMSLEHRIRPRHAFLVSLKKVPIGQPFPLNSLYPADEVFCRRWAGTTLDKYLTFAVGFQLKKFTDEYLIDEELEKNMHR